MMKKVDKIGCCLIIFLIFSQFLYFYRDITPKIISIILTFLLILLIIYKNKISYNFIFIIILNLYIIFRIGISGNYSMDYFAPMNIFISFFLLLQAYSIYFFLKEIRKVDENNIKKCIKLSLNSLIITILFSLYYVFFVDPQAIRNTQRQFLIGAGDFELVYTLSFIIGCLLCLKNKKKYILFYFLAFLTIFKSNLVTSCVILAITCIVHILFLLKNKKNIILFFVFSGISFILLRTKLVEVFIYLSKTKIFYWSTQKKLHAIANLLNGQFDNLDTLNNRWELITQSLNSFKSNLLFGINYKDMRQGIIGGHAGWTDMLAEFGIIGTSLILFIFISLYCEQIKNIKTIREKKAVNISWIIFIILGFFNPNLMGGVFYSMFIIAPFISALTEERKIKKHEKSIIN